MVQSGGYRFSSTSKVNKGNIVFREFLLSIKFEFLKLFKDSLRSHEFKEARMDL